MNLNNILILLLLLYTLILNINGDTLTFLKSYGEWNEASNWNIGRIPSFNLNDTSILLKDQVAVNFIEKIESKVIYIGDETQELSNTILSAKYGIHATNVYIIPNCSLYVSNDKANAIQNSIYAFNIDNLYNYGSLIIFNSIYYSPYGIISNQLSNDVIQNSDFIFGALFLKYSNTQLYTSQLILSIIQIESNSIFETHYNSISFNPIFYQNPKIIIRSSSFMAFYNSRVESSSFIAVLDEGSVLAFVQSNVELNDTSTEVYISNSTLLIYGCDSFISRKLIYSSGVNGTLVDITNSNVLYENDIFLNEEAKFSVINSTLTSKSGFYFSGYSQCMIHQSNATISSYQASGMSYCIFLESKVNVENDNPDSISLSLNDNSILIFYDSQVNLKTNLITTNTSILVGVDSNISIGKSTYFFKSSIIQMNFTNLVIDGALQMHNDSIFYGYNSIIIVSNSTLFQDTSSYSFSDCTIIINGQFIDQSKKFLVDGMVNYISNSIILISGYYFNEGASYFIKSQVQVEGLLYISLTGGLRFIDSEVKVNNSLINNFYLGLDNSKLTIVQGSIYSLENSYFISINSTIDIRDGHFMIAPYSNITLSNTTLINYHGILETNGDIIVNENGKLTNNAQFKLNSNIYFGNDSLSTPTANEVFTNNGILDISSNGTSTEAATNILINFINQNGTINIFKDTVILKLDQDNSNLALKYDNSSVTIKENLNSLNDSFTFSIGLNKSSEINVLQNATIQNANIVIRISTDLLSTNDYNNNKQINKTLLSTSNSLTTTSIDQQNIKFKSYDPSTGEEKDLNTCKHRVNISETSISLLLNSQDECSKDKKLSKGAIIGIVFGIIGLVAIVSIIVYYKTKLPKSQQLKYRLKKINETQQQTQQQP